MFNIEIGDAVGLQQRMSTRAPETMCDQSNRRRRNKSDRGKFRASPKLFGDRTFPPPHPLPRPKARAVPGREPNRRAKIRDQGNTSTPDIYAGFFDPGFGWSEGGKPGARAVLEVRSHEVPFVLEDGQVIGRLAYEKMPDKPELLYGEGRTSNYQGQGLKLSKHFRSV